MNMNIYETSTFYYTSKCMHGMNQTEAEYPRQQEVSNSKFEPNRPSSIGDITLSTAHAQDRSGDLS